jgi:hypothetical protein
MSSVFLLPIDQESISNTECSKSDAWAIEEGNKRIKTKKNGERNRDIELETNRIQFN